MLSKTLAIEMNRSASSIHCRNCGQIHNSGRQPSGADCFVLTVKRSGHIRFGQFDQTHSIILPDSAEDRQKLRDFIWEEFESIKIENDMDREEIATQNNPKGQLRMKAPFIWLSWTAVDGKSGQTRNKINFGSIWEKMIESVAERRPLVLTSIFLPTGQTGTITAETV